MTADEPANSRFDRLLAAMAPPIERRKTSTDPGILDQRDEWAARDYRLRG